MKFLVEDKGLDNDLLNASRCYRHYKQRRKKERYLKREARKAYILFKLKSITKRENEVEL